MAGWDHWFDVDGRDLDLMVDCLRIWRRTCARHRIEMTYHRDRPQKLRNLRKRFIISYNLQSANAPLAVAEFIIEMRALSTIQRGRRRRRLPLRFLRDVAAECVPESVEEQIDSQLVNLSVKRSVAEALSRFQSSFSAYQRAELSAADFLESQHSLVIDLGLLIGDASSTKDHYPTLVSKLTRRLGPESNLINGLKSIGTWRNRVKHKGENELAARVVDDGAGTIWRAVTELTGAYVDPVSITLREIEADPRAAFRLPSMFTRNGDLRSPHR